MLKIGVWMLVWFYVSANLARWHYARHYEEHFRPMDFRMMSEAWEYLSCSKGAAKPFVIAWLWMGLTLTMIGLFL
jgi:hypothetical protein